MNTKNEKLAAEKISAYIDDALNETEVKALLEANELNELDQAHFSVVARYNMVGDALRGELSDASMVDVSAQVRQALSNEAMATAETARPVKASLLSEIRFGFFAWLESFARPLTGMAVAVSVAMLMVVTVVQMDSPNETQQLASSATATPTLVANKPTLADNPLSEEKMAEFDAYLIKHAEFAAQDTLQGRIPYVRAVNYEVE